MLQTQRGKSWIRSSIRGACLTAAVVPVMVSGLVGCNRAHYRTRADQEVTQLIGEKISDAMSDPIRSVQVDRSSRMFDPFNPDRPPMPEDDNAAHEYMKVVNGKKGYPLWDVNGRTNTAENPIWWQYLPLDERGILVLDQDMAVRVATLNNTNYQQKIETLYLSALDVSSERFRLTNQLFATYGANYLARGNGASGGNANVTGIGFRRKFTAGGDLLVNFANSVTWSLTGGDTDTSSLVNFAFLQPLLRNGGRDVVLERLTLAERTLLYNVRAFERYRTGFYITVTVGRNAETGPTRRGGLFGGAGLDNFSGLGGGFGGVGAVQNQNATGGAAFGGGGAVPQVGGLLGLVQNQLQIQNAEENVARLRDNLARFEDTLREQLTIIPATQDTIPSQQLQVAQARQALISSQATLLQLKFNYEQSLDNFKVNTLGLPPYVCVEIKDPILDQFNLISEDIKQRRNQVASLRESIGDDNTTLLELSPTETDPATGIKVRSLQWNNDARQSVSEIQDGIGALENVRQTILGKDFDEVRQDIERLRSVLPSREGELKRLRQIYEQERGSVCNLLPTDTLDVALLDSSEMDALPDKLTADLNRLEDRFRTREAKVEELREASQKAIATPLEGVNGREQFNLLRDKLILPSQSLLAEFSEDVLALQVLQARARVESVVLPQVDLMPEEAVEVARSNRLDWMNARASLVDSWRAIELVADSLENVLDLVFTGDVGTNRDNPFAFRGRTANMRAGFQWDTALTRLNERNNYRQVLIEYQQAKRGYYKYEDTIWQSLRANLRNIRYNQYNFELQRYAVRIAAQQIMINEDLRQIRESLNQASGPTAARDSVSALQDLLSAQNTFLGVWVFYEAQRRNLDQDLGTIRVNADNIWIDPGQITSAAYGFAPQDGNGVCLPCVENGGAMQQSGYGEVPMGDFQPVYGSQSGFGQQPNYGAQYGTNQPLGNAPVINEVSPTINIPSQY